MTSYLIIPQVLFPPDFQSKPMHNLFTVCHSFMNENSFHAMTHPVVVAMTMSRENYAQSYHENGFCLKCFSYKVAQWNPTKKNLAKSSVF